MTDTTESCAKALLSDEINRRDASIGALQALKQQPIFG
jgi:hypothetical protein